MADMTPRTRILNAIAGKETDKRPFCPFLAYYWEALPASVRKHGQFAYMQELGADPLLRGFHRLSSPVFNQCTIAQQEDADTRCVTYDTPVGKLITRYRHSSDGDTWFLTDHPVTGEEDFKVLAYLYTHMTLKYEPEAAEAERQRIGDQGVLLPTVGAMEKTAFQSLVEHWCGTQALVYALYDFPEVVEETLEIMRIRDRESVENAVKSGADGFIFWEDSSTTNISPAMHEKYVLPEINEWGDIIHAHGKLLVHHACGHVRDLMPLISREHIDALESLSPPPTGNITLADARKALNFSIAIIGGIEPTVLLGSSMEALEAYVLEALRDTKGTRYVAANADSCPPGVTEEKFKKIAQLVHAYK